MTTSGSWFRMPMKAHSRIVWHGSPISSCKNRHARA